MRLVLDLEDLSAPPLADCLEHLLCGERDYIKLWQVLKLPYRAGLELLGHAASVQINAVGRSYTLKDRYGDEPDQAMPTLRLIVGSEGAVPQMHAVRVTLPEPFEGVRIIGLSGSLDKFTLYNSNWKPWFEVPLRVGFRLLLAQKD